MLLEGNLGFRNVIDGVMVAHAVSCKPTVIALR